MLRILFYTLTATCISSKRIEASRSYLILYVVFVKQYIFLHQFTYYIFKFGIKYSEVQRCCHGFEILKSGR